MKKVWLLLVVCLCLCFPASAREWLSVEIEFSVDLQKIFTAEERKEFGIDQWDAKKQRDFKYWLSTFAVTLGTNIMTKINDKIAHMNDETAAVR